MWRPVAPSASYGHCPVAIDTRPVQWRVPHATINSACLGRHGFRLDRDLCRIQEAAGIHLACREDHKHTSQCHVYGFHGFRYSHATYNYGRVLDRDLQEQMGHASFNTTQRYIKYAETHQDRVYDAYLPAALKNRRDRLGEPWSVFGVLGAQKKARFDVSRYRA